MNAQQTRNTISYIPFVYEMALSFFISAREAVDPVLTNLDGYLRLDTDESGAPAAPDAFAQKFGTLSESDQFQYIGMCIRATTNLGLAYTHVLRLLVLLDTGEDPMNKLLSETGKIRLEKLYDLLAQSTHAKIEEIYHDVELHDFEMEINLQPGTSWTDESERSAQDFRQLLGEWQSRKIMDESHLFLVEAERLVMHVLIPLRSIYLLDKIIGRVLAPQLSVKYTEMNACMSNRESEPKVDWDGKTMYVTLPDKLGRILEAKWDLNETSVVRIREKGSEKWSIGIETPFQNMTFIHDESDVEYEMQVTRKNQDGESSPVKSVIC